MDPLQWLLARPLWVGASLLLWMPALAALGRTQAIPALASSWVWPASGLALAYLWVYGRQYWPFVMAGIGLSLVNATLPHPALYLLNPALGALAPWVAVRMMGTLADQHRRSLSQILWGLLLWGILMSTLIRSGLNGVMLELLGLAPDQLWTHRLPAWGASSALGILLVAVPLMTWLLRLDGVRRGPWPWAVAVLAWVLSLEALRLLFDPRWQWPGLLLVPLLAQAAFSLRFGGRWGSLLVLGVAGLIGLLSARNLPLAEMLPLAATQWAFVVALALLNLGIMVVQSQWGARQSLLEQALHGGGIVAWSWNRASGNYWVSANWTDVTGQQPAPKSLDALLAMVHVDDRDRLRSLQQLRLSSDAGAQVCEFRLASPAEPPTWLRETGEVVLRDAQGTAIALSGMLQDVTQSRLARERLQLSEQRYRTLSSVAPVGIFMTDAAGVCIYVNQHYARLLKTTPERCLGLGWTVHLQPETRDATLAAWFETVAKGAHFHGESLLRCGDGSEIWTVGQAQPELSPEGKVLGYVGSLTDISEQKAQQDLIWVQAHMDALTGLPNRRLFMDRLSQELLVAERQGQELALLYIDLDQFKEVNDTLGHAVGDRLLVAAAQRIRDKVRASDTTARLGGDEFTVILSHLASPHHADGIAQKLVEALRAPFDIEGEVVYVSASIGITLFPEDGDTVLDLMKHADQAMYRAKAEGRNRFCYFTPGMQAEAQLNLALTQDLRCALAAQQLSLHYQPIVDLGNGRIVKLEALLRWQHPQRGAVSPVAFIPLAEESGLIHEIGDWVFAQAAEMALRLQQRLGHLLPINVNKSPRQFLAGDTELRWPALLKDLALPADAVCIEITEGLLLDERPDVIRRLRQLAEAGIPLALDDFGTGYSAMAYLKKFPIQQLKIDRSFVHGMVDSKADLAIVEAIVVMAHKLGLLVVAEGVETEHQRELLVAAGCDLAQGWLFGRPMPAEALMARVTELQPG
jgi:diguanylate cyclase (GGDEF)-like protein/PAS domain S-box-containing protein